LEALVQVSCVAQLLTSGHWAQVSGLPSWRYRPVVHAMHCELVALEQVIELVQNETGVQAWQESARSPPCGDVL
jgi:endonuclease I